MNSISITKSTEHTDISHTISAEILAVYNKQITKTGLLILKALEEHGGLQPKELSEIIHTSKNSMSNSLTRLNNIQPRLLNVTIQGRTKTYSLTNEARAYLQSQTLPTGSSNIRSFTDVNSPEYISRPALEILEQLQRQLTSPWDFSFDNILTGQTTLSDSHISDSCQQFMDQMAALTLRGCSAALNLVYKAISNSILETHIKEKLADMLGRNYQLLLPLYRLETENPQHALELIDEILSDLHPSIMKKHASVFRKVTDEEYYALFYAVSQMWNQFLACATKEEALERWMGSYSQKSWIPQQLASRFELISQIPRPENI